MRFAVSTRAASDYSLLIATHQNAGDANANISCIVNHNEFIKT